MEQNEMTFEFDSCSENEGLARTVVAAFITPLDPTLEELADVKTAVSEAVTNAVIHGYGDERGKIRIHSRIDGNVVWIEIKDDGVGIEDVARAMEPLYTTKADMERSGMGFAFMEAFMDELEVDSALGKGTRVRMRKTIYSALNMS